MIDAKGENAGTRPAHQLIEIAMNGPAKNALGTDMMTWLLGRLHDAAGAPILLTGAGDAFSAGLNLKEVAGLDPEGMARYLRLLERCMSALYQYPGPTVALVNGHAIAGGCVLTLACDYRVSTSDARARIGLNEVALGVRFPPRVLRIVKDRVPAPSLVPVLLAAELFAPPRAVAHGLVDETSEDPSAVARAKIAALAAHPADAYAATKRALRGAVDADLASDDAEAHWFRECVPIWTSDAVKERVRRVLGGGSNNNKKEQRRERKEA
jgi:enoyl-CoA hydratase